VALWHLPVERYGQQAEKTYYQLKMNPVLHQVSKQSKEARSHRPEVLDDWASERAIFGGEQFTRHHETWQNKSLTTKRFDLRRLVG